MRFLAALALIALVPIAAAGGYLANTDPAEPTIKELVGKRLLSDGTADDVYLFVVTKPTPAVFGAEQALPYPDSYFKDNGAKEWKWLKANCGNYSTSGNPESVDDAEVLSYCTQKQVTRKQAREGIEEQMSKAVAQGSPALTG